MNMARATYTVSALGGGFVLSDARGRAVAASPRREDLTKAAEHHTRLDAERVRGKFVCYLHFQDSTNHRKTGRVTVVHLVAGEQNVVLSRLIPLESLDTKVRALHDKYGFYNWANAEREMAFWLARKSPAPHPPAPHQPVGQPSGRGARE